MNIPRKSLLVLLAVLVTGCGTQGPSTTKTSQGSSSAPSAYTSSEINSVDPGSPTPERTPAFALVDQFGQPVSLKQFRGRVVLLSFDDDECTTICPLTDQIQILAKAALGKASSQLVLLGVNANPLHPTVADVRAYSEAHGLMNRWLFLTGSVPELQAVWKAFGIAVQVKNGQIDHTPALFLIDPKGRERRVFLTSADYGVVPLEAQTVAKAASTLIPGHPKPRTLPRALGLPLKGPDETITLPSLIGGAPSTLRPSSSRLLVFFASWAPEAGGGFRSLEVYEGEAIRGGLPRVVAVDVAPTEPSLTKPRAFVASISPSPSFPVAVDASGRVADAYRVKDIPWLVLVKGGKIVWHHDGWLPASVLAGDVARALGSGP